MSDPGFERRMLREFTAFVEAEPTPPDPAADAAVLRRVAADLRPSRWTIYTRMSLAQTAGGLLTLSVCPQFGLGLGGHHALLHGLHAALAPVLFYLTCGLIFISLGAVCGALLLRRAELRTLGPAPWGFFLGYSVLTYGVLVSLGGEAFTAASLAWPLGALAGNALGFTLVTRLRLRSA
jgi:hypothetical protein